MEAGSRQRGAVDVSILMPTFKHACTIRRAIDSVIAQEFDRWELIIVDDGSPDETGEIVSSYLADERIIYRCLPRNAGLGSALRRAVAEASGRYLAYLPSDDRYYPNHLALLVQLLDACPDVYLAYGGVRWRSHQGQDCEGATLHGNGAVGHERAALEGRLVSDGVPDCAPHTLLALAQVVHRRDWEAAVTWPTREERVSDTIEADYWHALLARGARFAYAGEITCEWTTHPDQRHKIIADIWPEPQSRSGRGLSGYRAYYGVGRDQLLNWMPSHGLAIDERRRYGRFALRRDLPAPSGLSILVVGELGFNPERLMAFEERGHKLYGLWITHPEAWDSTGPLPFGNITDIPYDANWRARVAAIKPDVIYALLNLHALPLISEVLRARLDIPLVFHFKESPHMCIPLGRWPMLKQILADSDGHIFISEENFEWYQAAVPEILKPEMTMILDGDLPKIDWMTENWSLKCSASDGHVHTVCVGRPEGLEDLGDLAQAGIHLHLYGGNFFNPSTRVSRRAPPGTSAWWSRRLQNDHANWADWLQLNRSSGHLHFHPVVEPNDWVRELSRYDAAWLHNTPPSASSNHGIMRDASWSDLNLPARIGTYAAAGLPWILKDNRDSRTSVQTAALHHDIGIFFHNYCDLAEQLHDRALLARLSDNMRAARHSFAFDTHVDRLIAFFHRVIAQHA